MGEKKSSPSRRWISNCVLWFKKWITSFAALGETGSINSDWVKKELLDKLIAYRDDSPDTQDVVALDGGAVSDQEHSALLLRHEEVGWLLAGHRAEVPAGKKWIFMTPDSFLAPNMEIFVLFHKNINFEAWIQILAPRKKSKRQKF